MGQRRQRHQRRQRRQRRGLVPLRAKVPTRSCHQPPRGWKLPRSLADTREEAETYTAAFPLALWKMLMEPCKYMYWVSDTHFVVNKDKEGMPTFLGRFLTTTKPESFMRSLNYWGFISDGTYYSNPHFQLLHPIHLVYLKRKSSSQKTMIEPQLHLEVVGTEWDDPFVLATVERQFMMGDL
jgi:hypothetical protein